VGQFETISLIEMDDVCETNLSDDNLSCFFVLKFFFNESIVNLHYHLLYLSFPWFLVLLVELVSGVGGVWLLVLIKLSLSKKTKVVDCFQDLTHANIGVE